MRLPHRHSLVTIAAVAAVLALAGGCGLGTKGSSSTPAGSVRVGPDLHALAWADGRLFVGGHEGAGAVVGKAWSQIATLNNIDAMSFAGTGTTIFSGGHVGLYASTDAGATFAPAQTNLSVTDIHGLGASGTTVILTSPEAGTFRSNDGGKTFAQISGQGQSFMGTIQIDSRDLNHALAPDMLAGIAETTDGGTTWHALGGPSGAMAVAWDPANRRQIAAVGMSGAQSSSDGGKTWRALDVPARTEAITYGPDGRLYAATFNEPYASMFVQMSGRWRAVP